MNVETQMEYLLLIKLIRTTVLRIDIVDIGQGPSEMACHTWVSVFTSKNSSCYEYNFEEKSVV